MTYLGLIQQALFFAFGIGLFTAAISRLLYPLVKTGLKTLDPAFQSVLVLAWCMLPVLAACAAVFLALLPSLLHLAGITADHCLGHGDGHIHFCLVHRPLPIGSWLISLPAGLFLAQLAAIVLHLAADIRETLRFHRRLLAYPRHQQGQVSVLHSKTPLALSCGLLKPGIYLSSGLLARLRADERDMIVAHERAHAERLDALRSLLARSFSLAHFPALRRQLLEHLEVATEQACDRSAVRVSSDPGQVAELLLKVERLYRRHFSPAPPLSASVLGKSGSTIPERVSILLGARAHESARMPSALPWLALPAALLLAHPGIHELFEHLMALIVGY